MGSETSSLETASSSRESANFWFLSGGTVFLRYTYDKAKRHHQKACAMKLEGIVSKRVDAASAPGNRGLRLKVKCLHREEFVVG